MGHEGLRPQEPGRACSAPHQALTPAPPGGGACDLGRPQGRQKSRAPGEAINTPRLVSASWSGRSYRQAPRAPCRGGPGRGSEPALEWAGPGSTPGSETCGSVTAGKSTWSSWPRCPLRGRCQGGVKGFLTPRPASPSVRWGDPVPALRPLGSGCHPCVNTCNEPHGSTSRGACDSFIHWIDTFVELFLTSSQGRQAAHPRNNQPESENV